MSRTNLRDGTAFEQTALHSDQMDFAAQRRCRHPRFPGGRPGAAVAGVKGFLGFAGLILLCVSMGLAGLGKQGQSDLARLHRQAHEAQKDGDYRTAAEKYERLAALRPDIAEVHASLGYLYRLLGRKEEALGAFGRAARLKPGLPGTHLYLGILFFESGRYEEALRPLKTALDLKPDPQVHRYLGYVYQARSSCLDAVSHLEKALAAEEQDGEIRYHLNRCYSHLAKRFHGELEQKFPDSFSAHLARAHFHITTQNWKIAREEYTRALEKRPQEKRIRQRIRWLNERASGVASPLASGPDDDLIDGVTRFLDAPPAEAIGEEVERYRARAHALRRSNSASAEELYLLAEGYQILSLLTSFTLQAGSDPYWDHVLKAESYEELGDLEGAIQKYRAALALRPSFRRLQLAIGELQWRLRRYDEALPALQEGLKAHPGHSQAVYQIGDILFMKGKVEQAEGQFLKALELDPGMVDAHLGLERLYAAQGQHQKSLGHLRKALEITPSDASLHYKLSATYRKLGQKKEAEKALRIFRELKHRER